MTKRKDISTSHCESSTCNNAACSTMAPAGGQEAAPATPKQTSTKPNSHRVTTLPSPTTPAPPPPARLKQTTALVAPSSPQPKLSAALQIHGNAAALEARQHPVGVTFSRPYGGGSRSVAIRPVDLASTMSYGRGNGPHDPVGVTFPRLFGARIGSRHSGGVNFSQARGNGNDQRYHPYQICMDPQPVGVNFSPRTADFLSQMEAAGSARRQARRENRLTERLAEWGATLRLGNEGSVDLNLKLRIV